jgi:hypothetical protein
MGNCRTTWGKENMGKGTGGKPFTRAGMVEFDVYAWYVSQIPTFETFKDRLIRARRHGSELFL